MVRKIIISFLFVLFIFSCSVYRKNEIIGLKNIPFDFKGKDTVFYKKDMKIQISHNQKLFFIYKSYNKSNAFEYSNVYTVKDKKYIGNGTMFYNMPIGIWESYDENGKLKKITNYDEPYKFSVNLLIKKMKKEYHINLAIDDKDRDIDVRRSKTNNIYRYNVRYWGNDDMYYRRILVNGTTGKTMIFQKFTIDSARYERPPQPDKLYFDSINRLKNNYSKD